MNDVIVIPEENRQIVLVEEDFVIEVPAEIRTLEVTEVDMILGSRIHTAGDVRRWIIDYSRWLDNTATIEAALVASNSASCTVDNSEVKGKEISFYLNGGTVGEKLTVTLSMTDSFDQTKKDTIAFMVVAP